MLDVVVPPVVEDTVVVAVSVVVLGAAVVEGVTVVVTVLFSVVTLPSEEGENKGIVMMSKRVSLLRNGHIIYSQ